LMQQRLGSGWRSRDPHFVGGEGSLQGGILQGPATWRERMVRWAPSATLAAVGISLVVHLALWIIAALILIGGGQAGGAGGGGGGGGAASFFGVEARGTRFAYIIDISGSMDLGVGTADIKRIDILKAELSKSVDALLENAFFFVALFSSDAKPLGGRMEWIA